MPKNCLHTSNHCQPPQNDTLTASIKMRPSSMSGTSFQTDIAREIVPGTHTYPSSSSN